MASKGKTKGPQADAAGEEQHEGGQLGSAMEALCTIEQVADHRFRAWNFGVSVSCVQFHDQVHIDDFKVSSSSFGDPMRGKAVLIEECLAGGAKWAEHPMFAANEALRYEWLLDVYLMRLRDEVDWALSATFYRLERPREGERAAYQWRRGIFAALGGYWMNMDVPCSYVNEKRKEAEFNESGELLVALDVLCFVRLCARRKLLFKDFSMALFLGCALREVPLVARRKTIQKSEFRKEHARDNDRGEDSAETGPACCVPLHKDAAKVKWGEESVFSTQRPSLRRMGEHVYSLGLIDLSRKNESTSDVNGMREEIRRAFGNGEYGLAEDSFDGGFLRSSVCGDGDSPANRILQEHGGMKVWQVFFSQLAEKKIPRTFRIKGTPTLALQIHEDEPIALPKLDMARMCSMFEVLYCKLIKIPAMIFLDDFCIVLFEDLLKELLKPDDEHDGVSQMRMLLQLTMNTVTEKKDKAAAPYWHDPSDEHFYEPADKWKAQVSGA